MRALAAIVVVAIAAPASAEVRLLDHHFGPPQQLLTSQRPRRGGSGPVAVIVPHARTRELPLLSASDRAAAQQTAAFSTGNARLEALDRLLGSLEAELDARDDGGDVMNELSRRAEAIAREPGLESYPYAAELMTRAAGWVALTAPALADQLRARVVTAFPSSPFAVDAHLGLATSAEEKKRWNVARAHLDAVVANGRGDLVPYARFRIAWVEHRAGHDKQALHDLVELAGQAPLLRSSIADSISPVYAGAGLPASHARRLFEAIDDLRATADHLRTLADEYANAKRDADAVIVLRDAIALDGNPVETCRDRADIVSALASAPNRTDGELALEELVTAAGIAGPGCAVDAERAAFEIAFAWHRDVARSGDRARVARMWTRAIALATSRGPMHLARRNLLALRWELARRDRRAATWTAVADLADQVGDEDAEDAARAARSNARVLDR